MMVKAAEGDDEPEGPSDNQRITDLEAKVGAPIDMLLPHMIFN